MVRSNVRLSVIALSIGAAFAAQAQTPGAVNERRDVAISRLTTDTAGQAQVNLHSATGTARFVRMPSAARPAPASRLRVAPSAAAAGDAARRNSSRQFLATYGGVFGLSNADAELDAGRMSKDRQGGTHFTHRQLYQGLPVFGAQLKTHFDAANNLTVVNGTFVPDIAVKAQPTRTADQAAAAAVARVSAGLGVKKLLLMAGPLAAKTPQLLVYRAGLAQGVAGTNHLAWQVEVGNGFNVREFVFVDAHTGKVIDKINGIQDAKNRRAFDSQGQTSPGPNYPNNPFWVEDQAFPTGTDEADNMIAASGETYDLFKNAFGRDSYDGNGATMDAVFNRGNGCPNASWNGALISFCPGVTSDDITAHEWGHAFTEYTHGLIYAWQPGALNEAYSDIWGETVDRLNGRGGDMPDTLRTAGACTASTPMPPSVTIASPPSIAGSKSTSGAAFGPQSFTVNTTSVVLVDDGSGVASDACTGNFVNAAAIAGKIALVDRGSCAFAVKVKNAQDSGAIAVVVANNQGSSTSPMGLSNDPALNAAITIPSLMVSLSDGTAIKGALTQAAVTASMNSGGGGSDVSVRWLMGEDATGFGGAIRDMYNPTCYGDPGKVTDAQYVCAFEPDGGGVHSNSGVPNHAYALLVDGGAYNGQNIAAIGLTKAAHIYFRAQTVYQGPASGFADHADAIEQSCTDLRGVNLQDLKTGAPSGEVINDSDCAQVAKAALAVELRTPPSQCNFQPVLAQSPPPLCEVGNPTLLATDTFEGGKRTSLRWVATNEGTGDFAPRNWGVVNGLPSGRAGHAIFAADPNLGTCNPGSDATAVQRLESPTITIPLDAPVRRMSFDHWVATESGYDGGNVKISVNGGDWQLVQAAHFIYNAYNTTLVSAAGGNTNPLAGQPAFSGTDAGSVSSSWGRSIIDLAPYAAAGDKVKLRFESGQDGCGGNVGWLVDDVKVYRCNAAP